MTNANPIRILLGFFGYAKVPFEAIRLSEYQEEFLKDLIKCEGDMKRITHLQTMLRGQMALTELLKSCLEIHSPNRQTSGR